MDDKEPLSQTDESKTISKTDDESKTRSRTERKPKTRKPTHKKPLRKFKKEQTTRRLTVALPILTLILAVTAFTLLKTVFIGEAGVFVQKLSIGIFVEVTIVALACLFFFRKGFTFDTRNSVCFTSLLLIGIVNFILPFNLKHPYAPVFYGTIGLGGFCSLCLSIINFRRYETPRGANYLFALDVYAFSLLLHWDQNNILLPMSKRAWDGAYIAFSVFVYLLFFVIVIIKQMYNAEHGESDD